MNDKYEISIPIYDEIYEDIIVVDATVIYEYTPKSIGKRDSLGAQIEPDEPESVEILKIIRRDTNTPIDLNADTLDPETIFMIETEILDSRES